MLDANVDAFLQAQGIKTSSDDVLAHVGVKGMKWGVTRTDAQLGNAAAKSPSSAKTSTKPKAAKTTTVKSTQKTKAIIAEKREASKVQAKSASSEVFKVAKAGIMPILIASGVGYPIAVGVSISAQILTHPDVTKAVAAASDYSAHVISDIGSTSMSVVKNAQSAIDISKLPPNPKSPSTPSK